MHVRCPHCRNPIELVDESQLRDIACPSCGSSFSLIGEGLTASYQPETTTIGHFTLLEQLGVGAFGTVWKAQDTELDRQVAIKIPRKEQLNPAESEQFLREARSVAQLKHPGIVAVHEVGREDDQVYIVSDFVQGATLSDWIEGQALTPHEAARLCSKIGDALHHAHEAGVIHRDLKPSNIMMDLGGEPHIMDFGLAKRDSGEITMTVDGKVLGTPAYMPPEQARGEAHQSDARSDVYSLGVILFQLLTGELPFRGNPRMLIVQILKDEPPSPRKLNSSISRDLETITLKCLEKDPGKRYQSASELADELRRFLQGSPIHARRISSVARTWRWCKREPVKAILVSLLVFLGVGGPLVALNQVRLRSRAENLAGTNERLVQQERQANEELQASLQKNARETKRARLNLYLSLAAQSQIIRTTHPQRGLLLAVEAFKGLRNETDSPTSAQTVLRDAIRNLGGIGLCGHEGSVWKVWFSPDARWLVTGSEDKAARLWDLTAIDPSKAAVVLRGHTKSVTAMAVNPDGHWLVTGSGDKTARLWDLTASDPSQTAAVFRGHDGIVTAMDFSPDNRWLVTRTRSNSFRLWDLTAPAPSETAVVLPGCEGTPRAVSFSPDNRGLLPTVKTAQRVFGT